MVFHIKKNKIINNYVSISQQYAITEILKTFNIKYSLEIYNLITFTPLNLIISILSVKLKLSPFIISLIIAFLV